ncbi:hypothetical protein [Streptomyces sp. BA2]|uniref:hypothetical protein n=1 Tax=Streptomyces sp. BA2 TaxID=436595 RepID=UPI00132243ED|nr:hypothetical protein [Streptomyces sp. BA2]MWA07762.1 hypothetical protein [Streptomyces sp. BA2]
MCALVLLSAGAASADSANGATQARAGRTDTPSPDGNPASKAAQAAGVCNDAVQVGATGHIKRGGTTIASVKQFYSTKCQENYGYQWVWNSFRGDDPYSVSVRVYSYNEDRFHAERRWNDTNQQEFWSRSAHTVADCTSAVGTLRPAGDPHTYEAVSERQC